MIKFLILIIDLLACILTAAIGMVIGLAMIHSIPFNAISESGHWIIAALMLYMSFRLLYIIVKGKQ
jgi:hypothetical protein